MQNFQDTFEHVSNHLSVLLQFARLPLIKAQVDKFITGMDVIKKNNFSDHGQKSVSHLSTVNGLNQSLEAASGQTSIVNCVRRMNQKLKNKLVMKFQLAHFTAIHGKPFKLYLDRANFEKDVHNVDLGNSYMTDTSCREMLHFLSKSIVMELYITIVYTMMAQIAQKQWTRKN